MSFANAPKEIKLVANLKEKMAEMNESRQRTKATLTNSSLKISGF